MTRFRIAATVCGVLLLSTAGSAQEKPNFSGRWVIVSPEKGAGQEQLVKHDDKTLTMSTATGGRAMTYQLDGVERRNAIPMRGGEVVILSKAAWEGNTVVITIATSYPNDRKTLSKEIWSIDDQGRLVIDFTETADGQATRSFKVIHTRKAGLAVAASRPGS